MLKAFNHQALRLVKDKKGLTSLEYSLLLGMIFGAVTVGMAYVGSATQTVLSQALGLN